MAFQKHALVALVGTWNRSDMASEVWTTGVRVHTGAAAGYWLEDPQAYANTIGPTIRTWYSAVTDNNIRSDAVLNQVKVNNIDAAGHYADGITHSYVVTPVAGGNTPSMGAQSTMCITHTTAYSSGRAKRGRSYFPWACSLDITGSASIGLTQRDKILARWKAFLTLLLINEPGGSHFLVRPCIVSRIDATIHDVTGVSMDPVIDTQRRRVNRAAGGRASLVFP